MVESYNEEIYFYKYFSFFMIPIVFSAAGARYVNMYPGKNYDYTFRTNPGVTGFAKMKNIDPAGDSGQGDVYFQNFMDIHGSWITQCSVQNKNYYQGTSYSCSAPAVSYDGRTRGYYDFLYSGEYLYTELS